MSIRRRNRLAERQARKILGKDADPIVEQAFLDGYLSAWNKQEKSIRSQFALIIRLQMWLVMWRRRAVKAGWKKP